LDHPARLRREETSERLASLPSLQKYISKLKEEIILLQSDLIVKVRPPPRPPQFDLNRIEL
jgi:hypothetical protein